MRGEGEDGGGRREGGSWLTHVDIVNSKLVFGDKIHMLPNVVDNIH